MSYSNWCTKMRTDVLFPSVMGDNYEHGYSIKAIYMTTPVISLLNAKANIGIVLEAEQTINLVHNLIAFYCYYFKYRIYNIKLVHDLKAFDRYYLLTTFYLPLTYYYFK